MPLIHNLYQQILCLLQHILTYKCGSTSGVFPDAENLGQLEGGIREDTKNTQKVSILFAELAFVPRDVQNIDGAGRQKVKDLVHALEANSDTLKVYTSTNVHT